MLLDDDLLIPAVHHLSDQNLLRHDSSLTLSSTCGDSCAAAPTLVFVDLVPAAGGSFADAEAPASSWVASFDSSSRSTCSFHSGSGTQQRFWPAELLPADLPQGATILALAARPSDAELRSSKLRAAAAASDLLDALLDTDSLSQLVLVGHGLGGHLLKEVVLEVHRRTTDPSLPPADRAHCRGVLAAISGAAFYSTPHKAVPRLALPEYEALLPDMAPVCSAFAKLAKRCGWRLLGVGAAAQGGSPPASSVPLRAAAKGMSHFVAVPADQASVSRPTSRQHPAYTALRDFVLELLASTPEAAAGGRRGDGNASTLLAQAASGGSTAADSAPASPALSRASSLKRALSGLLARASS